MTFVLSLAIPMFLFSNIVIFFFYNEKVQMRQNSMKRNDFYIYCSDFRFELFSYNVGGQCCYCGSIQVDLYYDDAINLVKIQLFHIQSKLCQIIIITENDLFSCKTFLSSSKASWRQMRMKFIPGSTLSTRQTRYLSTGTAVIKLVSGSKIST